MMVVKIEVWPGGDESRAREIERLFVANISALADTSDYVYEFVQPGQPRTAATLDQPDGLVTDHVRSDGAWELTRRVLQHAWGQGCKRCLGGRR